MFIVWTPCIRQFVIVWFCLHLYPLSHLQTRFTRNVTVRNGFRTCLLPSNSCFNIARYYPWDYSQKCSLAIHLSVESLFAPYLRFRTLIRWRHRYRKESFKWTFYHLCWNCIPCKCVCTHFMLVVRETCLSYWGRWLNRPICFSDAERCGTRCFSRFFSIRFRVFASSSWTISGTRGPSPLPPAT